MHLFWLFLKFLLLQILCFKMVSLEPNEAFTFDLQYTFKTSLQKLVYFLEKAFHSN